MDEEFLEMINGWEDVYPKLLEAQYPRIFAKIKDQWYSPSMEAFWMEILVDDRRDRQGFPPKVAMELFRLSQTHADIIEKMKKNTPTDPWSDVDEKKRALFQKHGYDFTPKGFLRSADNGDAATVILFLKNGADVNIQDERGWTPLIISCFNGNEEVARALIEYAANINATDKGGYGSMHWAAFNGYGSVVKLLIEKGADPDAQSQHGWTPLLQAATRNQLVAAGHLIAGGADVNLSSNDGWTPLHKAAANGHIGMVQLLLSKGAKPKLQYRDGTTALSLAIKNKHKDCADLLQTAAMNSEN